MTTTMEVSQICNDLRLVIKSSVDVRGLLDLSYRLQELIYLVDTQQTKNIIISEEREGKVE